MSTCQSCGGVIGRDCFNPQECMEITRQQAAMFRSQQVPESLYRRPQFQVGIVGEEKDDDPTFVDEGDAIDAASQLARKGGRTVQAAVWDDRGLIVHLFYLGQHFREV